MIPDRYFLFAKLLLDIFNAFITFFILIDTTVTIDSIFKDTYCNIMVFVTPTLDSPI